MFTLVYYYIRTFVSSCGDSGYFPGNLQEYYTTEAARGLGVLVEVGFSLILLNQGVWGAGCPTAGGETGRFLRTKTALEASKPHYFAQKFPRICNTV